MPLFNLEQYAPQLNAIAATPHGRVVGSIGRMPYFNRYLGDAFAEFKAREESGLAIPPSDIDVIGLTYGELEEVRAINPEVAIDSAAFDGVLRVSTLTGEDWMVTEEGNDSFDTPWPGSLFNHPPLEIVGARIQPVGLKCHYMLNALRQNGDKDRLSEQLMRQAMAIGSISLSPAEISHLTAHSCTLRNAGLSPASGSSLSAEQLSKEL